jgi:microcystin degradation protein MlrC
MNERILLAGLYHETHTFLGDITRADAVRGRRGEELLARRGDASTVDGFLTVAARESWRVVPLLEIGAMPSGTLDHAVFEAFWTEFERGARAAMDRGLDGVWLALHGAMVTTGSLDPEGELLARIRALRGFDRLPLFGVFDLHATFTPAMARHADCLVGYRENPHIDAFDMAACSAELLARSLKSGVRPRMATRTLPLIWPPTGTGTAVAPMQPLEAEARRIEAADTDIWAANVVGGYAFADTPDTGVSVSVVTTGSDAAAARHLDRLAAIAEAHKCDGVSREWTLDAAIDDALARGITGPVALVEPADNIGGGAPGDCTSILRAFLARRLPGSAVIMNDPRAVATLAGAEAGSTLRLMLGGSNALDPGAVAVEATLLSRSDGRFTLEDRNSHLAAMQGIHIDMGSCATVRADGVDILITSTKTPPFDLAQLRSQGIVPERLRFIGVKAAVAHRRAYDRITAASYWVDTPGPCPSDLTRLPYKHLRRPIFPLDPPWRPQ